MTDNRWQKVDAQANYPHRDNQKNARSSDVAFDVVLWNTLNLHAQNTKPNRATSVLGCRKCVPLKVDRKLYSATLLVRLAT